MTAPDDLLQVARRVVWSDAPQTALANPNLFLAHLMTYGTLEEVLTAKKYFSDDDFRAALDNAPPGVFDRRSWHYWNAVYHRIP
ncbi:MAG: hypothetical protein M3Y07_01625, partial [Acidobacteriota bacterium]|nr:hypothetical protein [Acidobacteriota bacterium]